MGTLHVAKANVNSVQGILKQKPRSGKDTDLCRTIPATKPAALQGIPTRCAQY